MQFFTYVADWIIFTKADHPGWASLIPFYNLYVVLKIVGRPGWWLILFFIPFVNIIVAIIVAIDMSKSFGHGGGFALGLIFLGPIFTGSSRSATRSTRVPRRWGQPRRSPLVPHDQAKADVPGRGVDRLALARGRPVAKAVVGRAQV